MKCPKCGKNTYYFTEGCYQEGIKISPDTGGCSSCNYRYLENETENPKEEKSMKEYLLNQKKEVKRLKDEQLMHILVNIEKKRQDFEEDNFKSGYIQAMLNYGIISGEQYEKIYE